MRPVNLEPIENRPDVVARARLRAAVVTGVAAGAWGLLLLVTSTVPATVPTLAGLLVGRL